MQIPNRFNLGETVYLRTDPDQLPRMVLGIKVDITKSLMYELSCGTMLSYHVEAEMCKTAKIGIEEFDKA